MNLPTITSIAILPFRNISGNDKYEFFSEGLTVEIINAFFKIG